MMRRSHFSTLCLVAGLAAFGLGGRALPACAQGDLEKTPWATTLVYPVGDPLDFQKPAPGDENGFSLSRGLMLGGRHRRHEGLDLANRETGSEVRAVGPGLVVCTRSHASGWGNMVVLAHRLPGGDVLFSLFAHLLPGSISVHEGEIVALGQPLGRVGRTGRATGPHLHLEFRKLAASLEAIRQPFAEAWEHASVVDPLRVFAAMRAPDDRFGVPPSLTSSVGTALPALTAAPPDPLALAVSEGGLPGGALAHADEALTRGELYRLAYAEIAPSGRAGRAIPNRWSALRPLIAARARTLPQPARAAFAADRLPRRASDAEGPATLRELSDVCRALAALREALPEVRRPDALVPLSTDLAVEFPHGRLALASTDASVSPLPLPAAYVGPPAVTRRQACLLVAYVRAGGDGADRVAGTEEP